MDDRELVSALIDEGAPAARIALNTLPSEFLEGDGRTAYEFVITHYKAYGKLPSSSTVLTETGVMLLDACEPFDYYVATATKRHLGHLLKSKLNPALDKLVQHDPVGCLEATEQAVREIRNQQIVGSKVVRLGGLYAEVMAYYERIEKGELGIQTPWAGVNDATLGFWEQDLVLFVARMGIGKTWASALIALHAWWAQKKRVLYATTEMSPRRIAGRLMCAKLKIPYGDYTHGRMTPFHRKRLEEGFEEIEHDDRFHVVGGDFDFHIGAFEAAIDTAKPDFVVLDGAYLLRVEGKTRTEKAANAFDELKRLTTRLQLPMVVTMQFNREVKASDAKSVKVESIALTDVAGWNADMIFALIQTDDMKPAKRMILKPLKVREGKGTEIECSWDLDLMDFHQIAVIGQGGGGDADESGLTKGNSGEDPEAIPF